MSDTFLSEQVKFLCSCGFLKPIFRVYFCRHCLKLRCGNCVSHEVDSTYCSACLEMMSVTEAGLKKNRCATCKDCPSCGHTLSTRATSIQAPSMEDPTKIVPRKVYYVACGFCRWTSRDSKLPDQNVASGTWTEFENPGRDRVTSLLDNYRALAMLEKVQKEQRKYGRQDASRRFLEGKDRFGVLVRATRKQAGLPPSRSLAVTKDLDVSTMQEMAAEAEDEADDVLPEEVFTEPMTLTAASTLDQRLAFPELQTPLHSSLQPQQRHALLKRSMRCRYCDHNLSKPEYSCISIKFRIQLNAYYHIPDVKIQSVGALVPGQETEVVMTFNNPTIYPMAITLEQYRDPDEEELREDPDPEHKESSLLRPVTLQSGAGYPSHLFPAIAGGRGDTGTKGRFGEFVDQPSSSEFRDDPSVVVWRQANKVALKLHLTPYPATEQAKGGSDSVQKTTGGDAATTGRVTGAFMVRYGYTNTIVTSENKSSQPKQLRARLLVDFGTLTGDESHC